MNLYEKSALETMSMKSTRIILILTVLMIAAAVLPAAALSEDYTKPDPASVACAWWDTCPPVKIIKQTRVVYRQSETLIESIPAEGYCYTAIKRVNVRRERNSSSPPGPRTPPARSGTPWSWPTVRWDISVPICSTRIT